MLKITCVHTAASPKIMELLEREFSSAVKTKFTLAHITLPEVIAEAIECGSISGHSVAKLLGAYNFCRASGADIVVNICSSVGHIADKTQEAYAATGMQLIRIDEGMCREAAIHHKRIAVLGTLPFTLEPSVELLSRIGREIGSKLTVKAVLAEGGFGKSQDELNRLLCDSVRRNMADIDAVILAQASMVFAESELAANTGLPIYSSPKYAARQIARLVDCDNRDEE